MTCAACGLPACAHPDPLYAGIAPSLPAATSKTHGRPLAGDRACMVTGDLVDQRASNGDAGGLRGKVHGVAVHSPINHGQEAFVCVE